MSLTRERGRLMAVKADYPKRPSHFAHKFCRLLAKSCVANELGAETCWLLSVIAHTEDAGGYRHAVTYHNGQLMAFCGFGSEDKLSRCRKKAVDAGWLHYIPGARGVAARYWVVVPECQKGRDDLPSDERPSKYETEESSKSESQYLTDAGESAVNPRSIRGQSAGESAVNVRDSSSLHLNLDQDPLNPPNETGEIQAIGPRPGDVRAAWNAQAGLVPVVGDDVNRDRLVRNWAMQNPLWSRHWRAVIEFMGRTPLYCGGGPEKWRADLTWLLKASNFTQVCEKMLAAGGPKPALYVPVIRRGSDNPGVNVPNSPPWPGPKPKPNPNPEAA